MCLKGSIRHRTTDTTPKSEIRKRESALTAVYWIALGSSVDIEMIWCGVVVWGFSIWLDGMVAKA